MTTPLTDPGHSADTLTMSTAIVPGDVRWYLSNPAAGTGYAGNGTPAASLGGWMSVTQVSANPMGSVFSDLTIVQNDAGQVDYRCLFVANFTATGFYMKNPYIWMPESYYVPAGAVPSMGMDPAGVVPYQSSSQQAAIIGTSLIMPPVTQWYGPAITYTFGLPLPDIPPGYAVGIWLRRIAMNSVAFTPQILALQVAFNCDM